MPSGIGGGDSPAEALQRWGGDGSSAAAAAPSASPGDPPPSSIDAEKQRKLDELLASLDPAALAYLTQKATAATANGHYTLQAPLPAVPVVSRVALVPLDLSTESGEEADAEDATAAVADGAAASSPLPRPVVDASAALHKPPQPQPPRRTNPPPPPPPPPAPPSQVRPRGSAGLQRRDTMNLPPGKTARAPPPGSRSTGPPAPPAHASSVDRLGVLNTRQRVVAFYRIVDRTKDVDGLLEQWVGREGELLTSIAGKYGQDALDASDRAALADPPARTRRDAERNAINAAAAAKSVAVKPTPPPSRGPTLAAAAAKPVATSKTLEPLPAAYAKAARGAAAAMKRSVEESGVPIPSIEDGRDVETETAGFWSGVWGALGYGDPSVIVHLGTSCVASHSRNSSVLSIPKPMHKRWQTRGEQLPDFTFRLAIKVNGLPLTSPSATIYCIKQQVRSVVGVEADYAMALCTDPNGLIPISAKDIDAEDGSMPNELYYVRRLYDPLGAWEMAEQDNTFLLESAWRSAVEYVVGGLYPLTTQQAIKLATLQLFVERLAPFIAKNPDIAKDRRTLATLRKRLSRTVGSEDVVAALPHYLIAWAGLSKAQLANAIKTALAQVANEVR